MMDYSLQMEPQGKTFWNVEVIYLISKKSGVLFFWAFEEVSYFHN